MIKSKKTPEQTRKKMMMEKYNKKPSGGA